MGDASAVEPRWGRVLLKLSGEAFAGDGAYGIDGGVVQSLAREEAFLGSGDQGRAVVQGDEPQLQPARFQRAHWPPPFSTLA